MQKILIKAWKGGPAPSFPDAPIWLFMYRTVGEADTQKTQQM